MTITWLHLSDIHVEEKQNWDADLVLQSLVRDLPDLLKGQALKPDFALITGDIAYSGKRQEYELVHRLLTEIGKITALSPQERFFLTPGNHDVNRSAVDTIVAKHHRWLQRENYETIRAELGDIVGNAELMRHYGKRIQEYCEFTGRLIGPARAVTPDRPYRTDILQLNGASVGIASLCSAWTSGPEDAKGKLFLGERQVRNALSEIAHTDVRIAILHHPLSWLHDAEDNAIRGILSAQGGVHVVAYGHLHNESNIVTLSPSRACLYTGAGALYQSAPWRKGFLIGQLAPSTGEVKIHHFTYSSQGRGFWSIDSTAVEGAQDGISRLSIHSIPSPARAVQVREKSLSERIRAATERVHGQVRFIGLPDHAPKPTALLEDLFIPLNFSRRHSSRAHYNDGDESQSNTDTASIDHITEQLNPTPNPARIVILGSPGSGKTTIVRYVAVKCSRSENLPLPLVLSVRDYIREGGSANILSFIASDINNRLAISISQEELSNLCKTNPAVLLVDGLDEVGDEHQRVELRDRIVAISIAYPSLSIIATTRIVGYDKAQLPDQQTHKHKTNEPIQLYEHLWLTPFTDAQLENYISSWYKIAEPNDPVASHQGKQALLTALDIEPRTKELARNPLLATLICLVHRHESRLPSERAKLYELCVRLLLDTWPAARRKEFQKIDPGQQRHALEQLALHMQVARARQRSNNNHYGVTIARKELETLLTNALQYGPMERSDVASLEHTVRDWIDYLQDGSGILVEQYPGVFGFMHLSLLEYLAGKALLQREQTQGYKQLAETVATLLSTAWWEPLLLMMGSESENHSLVQHIFDALTPCAKQDPFAAEFLLACMRDEITFHAEQRDFILRQACFFQRYRQSWRMEGIISFSRKHGAPTIAWFKKSFQQLTGKLLRGAVKLSPIPDEAILANLNEHESRSSAADSLVNFWPRPVGLWAVQNASNAALIKFVMRVFKRGAILRLAEIATLEGDYRFAAAMCAALLKRCAVFPPLDSVLSLEVPDNSAQLKRKLVAGTSFTIEPRAHIKHPIRWRRHELFPSKETLSRLETTKEGRTVKALFAAQAHIARRLLARRWHPDNLSIKYSLLSSVLSSFRIKEMPPVEALSGNILRAIGFLPFKPLNSNPPIKHPPSDNQGWTQPSTRRLDNQAQFPWSETVLDVILGLSTETRATETCDTGLFASMRGENRIANSIIEPLASFSSGSPGHHALLLALGLAQYQTTWAWPSGSYWQNYFSKSPPEHWLPAYFWHLCWCVSTPSEEKHWLAAIDALVYGKSEWPELAKELQNWMPQVPDTFSALLPRLPFRNRKK